VTDNVENLIVEHLKRIQAELSDSRARDQEILIRLGHLEAAIARIGSTQTANYEEIIGDRLMIDKLRERIERRLELAN